MVTAPLEVPERTNVLGEIARVVAVDEEEAGDADIPPAVAVDVGGGAATMDVGARVADVTLAAAVGEGAAVDEGAGALDVTPAAAADEGGWDIAVDEDTGAAAVDDGGGALGVTMAAGVDVGAWTVDAIANAEVVRPKLEDATVAVPDWPEEVEALLKIVDTSKLVDDKASVVTIDDGLAAIVENTSD